MISVSPQSLTLQRCDIYNSFIARTGLGTRQEGRFYICVPWAFITAIFVPHCSFICIFFFEFPSIPFLYRFFSSVFFLFIFDFHPPGRIFY